MWADSDGLDVLDPLDEVFLAELGDVLRPAAILEGPSPAEFAALDAAVVARFGEQDNPAVSVLRRRRMRSGPVGSAWRVGSAAAAVVVLSASAAAAAGGGVPMPRPVRAIAYAVGLPVDSPALDDTHRHLRALDEALHEGDRPAIRRRARQLEQAVAQVPADERDDAEEDVAAALAAAAPLLDDRQSGTDRTEDPASVPTESSAPTPAPPPRPTSTTATDTPPRGHPTTPTSPRIIAAGGSATPSDDAPGTDAETASTAASNGDDPAGDHSADSSVAPDPDSDPAQDDPSVPFPGEEQSAADDPEDGGDPRAP